VTSNTPPLTNYGFKGYSEGEDRAITPPGAKATTLNFSPDIFNNEVVLLEINWEPKDLSIFKENGF